MNSIELAKHTGVSRQAIEKKRAKALQDGGRTIEVAGKMYVFTKDGGRYDYEPLEIKQVETKRDAREIKYLSLPVEKRKEAELRLDLVRLYERRGNKSYKAFMQTLPRRFGKLKFSKRQFERWVKAVRECPSDVTPLVFLADKRGMAQKNAVMTAAMREAIVRMMLEKPHRKAKRIWEYLHREFEEVPTYETVRRYMKEWKSTHAFVWDHATNPDKAKGKYKPALGNMSESVMYPNQLWELDATPADVICSDGKRYVISAAIDVYSRRPAIVVEESADYSTLAKVMRKAIKKFGVPEAVKIDNGKDYTSNYFDATCSRLRINKIVVPPFSGEYKPHIERFFRTLSMQLFEELEGYIGHSVSDRSDLQSQMSFAQKLESIERWKQAYRDGNEFASRWALKKENAGLDIRVPLSKEELQLWIDRWVADYEQRRHAGIKTTPMKRWERSMHEVRTVSDERTLDMLLGVSEQRSIAKKGITLHGVTYIHELFGDMVGERVWVLTDDDLGRVYIYDMQMNYICTARNAEHEGESRSEALKATKRYTKKVRKVVKALKELREEAPQRMQEQLNERLGLDANSDIGGMRMDEDAIETIEAVLEESKTPVEADVRINGRPVFGKLYDRFLWDMEHDMVDESTKRLAQKHETMWEMASREFARRRAG